MDYFEVARNFGAPGTAAEPTSSGESHSLVHSEKLPNFNILVVLLCSVTVYLRKGRV